MLISILICIINIILILILILIPPYLFHYINSTYSETVMCRCSNSMELLKRYCETPITYTLCDWLSHWLTLFASLSLCLTFMLSLSPTHFFPLSCTLLYVASLILPTILPSLHILPLYSTSSCNSNFSINSCSYSHFSQTIIMILLILLLILTLILFFLFPDILSKFMFFRQIVSGPQDTVLGRWPVLVLRAVLPGWQRVPSGGILQ